jgi:MFS family permease
MKKLFWERSFDSVATNLVSIFIPIYLLRLHYRIETIFMFYALAGVFMILLYPLGFKSIIKIGANRSIVLGNIANAIFFLLLFELPHWHEALWVIAIFRGAFTAFYYPAFTANFVAARVHRRTGQQLGQLNAIALLLGGLAPAIGGFAASRAGLGWVYVSVIIAIIIANIPLIVGKDIIRYSSFELKKIPWKAYKDFIANGLYNVPGFVETAIWPLAISLFVASYSDIGLLSSVIVLTAIAISLYVGTHEDRVGEKPYINEGVFTSAVSNCGKLLASTPIGVLGVNFVSGTSDALLANSFISRYYKNADNDQMLEYTFGMEVAHAITWVLYFGLLAILATWLSLKAVLLVGIILAIPSALGIRMIKT